MAAITILRNEYESVKKHELEVLENIEHYYHMDMIGQAIAATDNHARLVHERHELSTAIILLEINGFDL